MFSKRDVREGRSPITRVLVTVGAVAATSAFVVTPLLSPPATSAAEPELLPSMGLPVQALAPQVAEAPRLEQDQITVVTNTPTPTPTPTPSPEPTQEQQQGEGSEQQAAEQTESEPQPVSVPQVAPPDPGSAQAIARNMLAARGWGDDQYSCLYNLWMRESNWNVYAMNPSSGAYGIPQSLPGDKMASHGADWQTNPATQIAWGIDYIAGRYGTPCGAWGHSEAVGWY